MRRDGRANGTAILRRSSTTPFHNQTASNNVASALDNSLAGSTADPSIAPSTDSTAARYSYDELLGYFHAGSETDVNTLLMGSFTPGAHANGNATRGWGKSNDSISQNDPGACWEAEGSLGPLGHQKMSEAEKDVRTISISIPLSLSHRTLLRLTMHSVSGCTVLFYRCQLPPEAAEQPESAESTKQGR